MGGGGETGWVFITGFRILCQIIALSFRVCKPEMSNTFPTRHMWQYIGLYHPKLFKPYFVKHRLAFLNLQEYRDNK